jgi:hypothetical protein
MIFTKIPLCGLSFRLCAFAVKTTIQNSEERVQLKVMSPPESFLFILSLSSFSLPVPDERER